MITEKENIEIIDRCKKGDKKAQEQLYRSYYKAMAAICMRYMGNNEEAIDVLNNGFLKAFKSLQRYDSSKAVFYTWLRTIVINSCLDRLKVKERMTQHQELNEALEVHIPAEAMNKMKATEILNLVRQLPPATQTVFNMYVIDGYNHREIAKMLTISEGTSKWHLSEARKNLQKMIRTQEVSI